MIPSVRQPFNNAFKQENYQSLLEAIDAKYPQQLDFRIAETPVFMPASITGKMLDACEYILDVIQQDSFQKMTERSIPENCRVCGNESIPEFIVFDFGICTNEKGEPEPKLIELQGFPSLFCYQSELSQWMKDYAQIGKQYSSYLNQHDAESHLKLLKELILGNHAPEQVILLEIYPEKQKTRIDFACTAQQLGIQTVCYTQLIKDGKELYYNHNGIKTKVERIFNRMIFDDLHQQEIPEGCINLSEELDVEWAPHPHWYYRISKFSMPFLHHELIPETFFLSDLKQAVDLKQYVLKPLFSFAGMGVQLDIQQQDLDNIPDPENWILQKKVEYAPIIPTLDEPAKLEVRLFYYWNKSLGKHQAVHNLARLSKGAMIGTRYNKDKTWVGGTIAFFEHLPT